MFRIVRLALSALVAVVLLVGAFTAVAAARPKPKPEPAAETIYLI